MLHLDRFLIIKGEGVHDLWDFINAALQTDNPQLTTAALANSHHDIQHSEITGVEGDAAHEAYRKGLIDEETARIYHEGPSNPKYMEAFRRAALAGAPLINSLVERQNVINASRGIHAMNKPFSNVMGKDYQVDGQWGHKPHALSMKDVKRNSNGRFIDPWDPQTRKLVTNIKSEINLQGEGWLRPYSEALEERRGQGGPQHRKKTNDTIHPGLVHRNTIRIPDRRALVELWNTVKEAQATAQQTGADPAQAAHQALMQNKTFKKVTGGIHHRSFEESYAQYADNAAMFTPENQNIPNEMQTDSMGDPTVSSELAQMPLGTDLSGWTHPELQEKGWHKNLHIGGKNGHSQAGGGMEAGVKDLMALQGLTEEQARGVWQTAHAGTRKEGNFRQRWNTALAHATLANSGGVAPNWVAQGTHMPMPQQPLSASPPPPAPDSDTPQQATPSKVTAPGMDTKHGGMTMHSGPPTVAPPPTDVLSSPPGLGAGAVAPPPPKVDTQIAPPPSLGMNNALGAASPPSTRRGVMDSLGGALGRLYGNRFPGGIFGKSDGEKQQIEQYLEQVQIDIAKSELTISATPMNPESPVDISIVAGRLKKTSSDITAIIHSRGDWRDIAKSFNVPHEAVQEVKVIFNE